jgi:hypothetical protein
MEREREADVAHVVRHVLVDPDPAVVRMVHAVDATVALLRSVAAISGSAAFLLPLGRMRPPIG